MKLCRLNIEKDNATWSPFEPDEHFDQRRTVIVADDYNFNNENDTDVTEDASVWVKHFNRLGINYFHFLKKLQSIIIPKCNPNYPALDYSGIDNLSAEELEIGTKYHVLPYSVRVGSSFPYQVTDEIDSKNWYELLDLSKEGRSLIVEKMRKETGELMRIGSITLTQTQNFFRDVFLMLEYYINASDPEFKVFLKSLDEGGYDYTETGFASKDYYTVELYNILLATYMGETYS